MDNLNKILVVSGWEVESPFIKELMKRHKGEIVVINNGINNHDIDDSKEAKLIEEVGKEINLVSADIVDDATLKRLVYDPYFYDKPSGGSMKIAKPSGRFTPKKKKRTKTKKTHRRK